MLSVIVITKNEERRIKTCLESVKWADEVIVVDNGSSDHTGQIVKNYTKNFFTFSGEDFSALRNEAIKKARGDWVLFVDADERVLEDLKREILELIKTTTKSAFAISRRNIIFGIEQRYGPFWPDWVVRLLKRKDFVGFIGKIHEYPKFNGELGYTKNSLLHLTHRGVDHIVLKSLEWSKIDAKLRIEANHPKMSALRFIHILIKGIVNQGIIRKGFFAGTIGTMDSILQAFSLFITYVRLWELQQPKGSEQIYDELDEKLISSNFKDQ